jgi:hypothetical protein
MPDRGHREKAAPTGGSMENPSLDLAFIALGVMAALLTTQQSSTLSQRQWRHHTGRSISLTWRTELEGMTCALLGTVDCPGLGGVLVEKH